MILVYNEIVGLGKCLFFNKPNNLFPDYIIFYP